MPTAPSFVQAGTGVIIQTGSAAVTLSSVTIGNIVVLHTLVDGNGSPGTFSSESGLSTIIDNLGANFGSCYNSVKIYRATSASISITSAVNASGHDQYARWYEFAGVSNSDVKENIYENSTAGSYTAANGVLAQIDDSGVTTLGPDRLACNFIVVNDDNAVGDFTGMSGGTWTEATAEFASATGTDGCIQLQIATMTSPGTINGGSYTMAAADAWVILGLAFKPIELPPPIHTPYKIAY